MKVDSESQLFLLLVWLITLIAFLASLFLLREVRTMRAEAERDTAPPMVAPKLPMAQGDFAPKKSKDGFVVPPPPETSF